MYTDYDIVPGSNTVCAFDMKMGGESECKISSRGVVNTERAETSASVQNQASSGNSRTLRLFGVDLECQLEEPLPDGPNQKGEPQYYQQSSSSATTSYDHVSHYQNHVVSHQSQDSLFY